MFSALSSLPALSRRLACGAAAFAVATLAGCGGGGGGAVGNGGGTLRVVIAPGAVTLAAGATQLFSATIDGVPSNDVRFEVSSGVGTIDAAGRYAAPNEVAATATAQVRAVATADPASSAVATITVQPRAVAAQFELGVKLGLGGGAEAGTHLRDRAELAVDAVIEATRLAGRARPVFAGTLRVVNNQLTFAATPTDRLVLELGAQGRHELAITALTGDLSQGAARFLTRDHVLRCRVVGEGVDVELSDVRTGIDITRTLRGVVPFEDQPATVDLSEQEQVVTEVVPGVDFRALTALTGTIDLAGVHVDVNEALDTRIVINTRAVEQFKRFQRSEWTVGAQRFALQDVEIFSLFVDAEADERDFWRGQGALLQNGQTIGIFTSTFEASDFVVRLDRGGQLTEVRRIPLSER